MGLYTSYGDVLDYVNRRLSHLGKLFCFSKRKMTVHFSRDLAAVERSAPNGVEAQVIDKLPPHNPVTPGCHLPFEERLAIKSSYLIRFHNFQAFAPLLRDDFLWPRHSYKAGLLL